MPIAIRRAEFSDATLLTELRLRAYLERHGGDSLDHATFVEECEVFFGRELKANAVRAWLAFDEGRAVGVAALHVMATFPRPHAALVTRTPRDARVRNVFVEPEYRRRGIASRLMNEVIAEARRERVDRLMLGTSEMGRPLYEHLGFIRNEGEMLYVGR